MRLGIVCGYGIIVDQRLQTYLNSVIQYVTTHHIQNLLLTGGYTVQNANTTEAQVLARAIQKIHPDINIMMEDRSITTLHNLLYSKHMIETLDVPIEDVYIFCDAVRFMKVFCLSKILFKNYPVHVVSFKRKEPLFMYILQIPFTLIQCLGAIFPKIERTILSSRQRWMKIHK